MASDNSGEGPSWMNESDATFEGLEDISVEMEEQNYCESEEDEEDECVDSSAEEGWEESFNEGGERVEIENGFTIGTVHDIRSLDLKSLTPYELRNVEFVNLEMAYMFYSWFARVNGFATRKSKVVKNRKGEKLQQTFVCYKQGFREDRGLRKEDRKREVKPETRCGCEAKFRVHIDMNSRLWYITYFLDEHNHELLEDKYCRMLASHRRISESDILQMNNMRKVGIGTSQIYGSFANQCGGYERIGFRKKDIYNQSGRQRKLLCLDAKSALQYLSGLGVNDPLMYFRHTVDDDSRLQHLFWCDGHMQMDYKIFGDVLAFDATYGKNKYECPLVIFSGVNHHNETVVFGSAVVANETEETYVWVLEQFLEAMKGRSPVSVITDGDVAIKNAIRRVFPNAHHRLCAWHLLRNATTKIGNPTFTAEFRRCMLGDYEIGKFRSIWEEMISKLGLQNHPWVLELYEKRKMWCTAYIRGQFFTGFRTTSRCEGLHSEIAKFIYSRYNLTELLQHFQRCLNLMRYREVESDFASIHGDAVLQTNFQSLERSTANVYTREIFKLFHPVIDKSSAMRVIGCKESFSYTIYTVSRYQRPEQVWQVSFQPSSTDFKCSCQRMESFGLPCEHIVGVVVYLNISELPSSLIMKRWTKYTKDEVRENTSSHNFWDSHKDARYLSLIEYYREVSVLAAENFDDYDVEREKAINERDFLMAKKASECKGHNVRTHTISTGVRDPVIVRTKGRAHNNSPSSNGKRTKSVKKCTTCRQPGHNRRSCPTLTQFGGVAECPSGVQLPLEEDEFTFDTSELNADIGQEYIDDESAVDRLCLSFQESTYNELNDH